MMFRSLRSALAVTVLATSLSVAGTAFALPPEIELDRLLLAAESAFAESDIPGAADYLQRIEPLGVELPAQYHWLKSKVLVEQAQWADARHHIERYLTDAGREAPHYQQALQLLTRIEQAEGPALPPQGATHDPAITLIKNQQAANYDKQVQSLYLGDNVTESLVTHLNALLQAYRYLDGRVKNLERSDRIEYSLSVRDGSTLVIARRDIKQTAGGPRTVLNMSYLGVFGVDPLVKFRCSDAADNCTFRHPVDGSDWLQIAYNESGAQEIAVAMTRLLQALQRGKAQHPG